MSEEFVFNCVGCGTELVGSKDLIGRSVRCYKCDAKQEVLRPKNSIKFNCISCGVNLATTECLVGTNVRCFHCNTKQKVPQNKKNEAKTYQRPKKKLRKVSAKNSKKLKAKSYNTVSKNKNILVSTLLLVVTLSLSFLFVKVFTKVLLLS